MSCYFVARNCSQFRSKISDTEHLCASDAVLPCPVCEQPFQELYVAIVNTLTDMELNLNGKSNRDTRKNARSFLGTITRFEFVVGLVFTRNVFDLTIDATKMLQAKDNDILDAIRLVDTLKNHFNTIRIEMDQYHQKWYSEALVLAAKVETEEQVPITASA